MSLHQHGYPWPFPVTLLYRLLLPASLQGYISYRHGAAVCRFLLVVLWRGPQEYINYEFVLTSPAVSCMSGSSNFDSFRSDILLGLTLSFFSFQKYIYIYTYIYIYIYMYVCMYVYIITNLLTYCSRIVPDKRNNFCNYIYIYIFV